MEKGKAYFNRKNFKDDYYQTPKPLTRELLYLNLFDFNKTVLEPCCQGGAIVDVLKENFKNVVYYDVETDFLKENRKFDYIITNPPFKLFDKFVLKAKEVCLDEFAFIGRTNYFGAFNRFQNKIWENLKYVYIFNRQVDYRFFREDEKLICGGMVTGWFIWSKKWDKDYWETRILDVQKYIYKNC